MPSTSTRRKRRYRPRRRGGFSKKQVSRIKSIAKTAVLTHDADNYFDRLYSSQAISSGGTVFLLSGIARGLQNTATSYQEREKDEITAKSLQIKFEMIVSNSVPADNYNIMRIIVFRYQGNGQPTVANILDGRTISTLTNSFYTTNVSDTNYNNSYKIMFDRRYVLTYTGGATDTENPRVFSLRYKWPKGLDIHYDGSSASAVSAGNLYVLAVSDSALIGHPTLTIASRLRYST